MKKSLSTGLVIVTMFVLILLAPFIQNLFPISMNEQFRIILSFVIIGVIFVIVLFILVFLNKKGINSPKKEEIKPIKAERIEKNDLIEKKDVKENKKVEEEKKKEKDKSLKQKREELVQKLNEAEKKFLKNQIDKDTFHSISKQANAELISVEAELDSQKKINLGKDEIKQLDNVSKDKKKVLQDLLEQKQKKVYEARIAEKSFYKRKIDEPTFKKISSDVKSEIISIDGKIKAIQKSEEIEKMKKELLEGTREVTKQKQKSEKRKDETEIFEEDLFAQIDEMSGGLKR